MSDEMSKLLKIIGNPSTCGNESRPGCGAVIWWVSTKQKKAMPLNPDGTPHWATCPNVRQFRKDKAQEKIERETNNAMSGMFRKQI